jgi:hypothetical protein
VQYYIDFHFIGRIVAGQTSLNMPKELLEALRTVAGQTSLNMSNELLEK